MQRRAAPEGCDTLLAGDSYHALDPHAQSQPATAMLPIKQHSWPMMQTTRQSLFGCVA